MPLFLPTAVRQSIIEDAIRTLPAEAVGLVGGKQNHAQVALPLRNLAGERAFLADPYDQFRAERALQSQGLDLLAIYHSHPEGCACLSDVDLALANDWSCIQIVVAIESRTSAARLRGYRIVGAVPSEIPLICSDEQQAGGKVRCQPEAAFGR